MGWGMFSCTRLKSLSCKGRPKVSSLERSSGVDADASIAAGNPFNDTFIDIAFAVDPLETGAIATALVIADEIDATAAIFTWIRFAFVDVRFTIGASVAKAAGTHRRIVRRQTKATVLTGLNRTEWNVTEGSLQSRTAFTCEVVSSGCI